MKNMGKMQTVLSVQARNMCNYDSALESDELMIFYFNFRRLFLQMIIRFTGAKYSSSHTSDGNIIWCGWVPT